MRASDAAALRDPPGPARRSEPPPRVRALTSPPAHRFPTGGSPVSPPPPAFRTTAALGANRSPARCGSSGPKIVIAGTREDWPGGVQTLTPRDPTREPNGTFWFGAELDPAGGQVWFRIAEETIGRMREKTPRARGTLLVDALIVWITPDRQLAPGLNRFEVRVSEAGDTWLERLRW